MQITPSSLMAGTMVAVRIHIVLVQIEWVWSTQPQNHSKGIPYLAVIRVGHFEMQPWLYFKLLPAERTIIDRYDNYLCKMVDSNHSNNQPNDTTTQQQNTQTPSFLVETKQYDLSKGAQLDISNRIKVFHIIFHCNAIQLQPFERGKQR